MKNLNKIIIIGNLTKDCNVEYLGNGTAKGSISIAVNDTRKSGNEWIDEVSYFDVTIWGKMAENLKQFLTKGQKVAIEGKLKQDRWEKDGQKFSRILIIAESVELLGGGKGKESNSTGAEPMPQEQFPEDMPF